MPSALTVKIVTALAYFAVVFYLGYRGWKETTGSDDYMLAGRKMKSFVMAMSYGATFISTSAIIGFGGASAMFGLDLLWLMVLNIVVGIVIAMLIFGKRTRRMGLALNAETFPELLGRRYKSRFIQAFAGGTIFTFIPLYAAAVLIGICRMLEVSMGLDFHFALVGFTLLLAVYVISGGMKAVMYTEAFQGCIMVGMMLVLLYVVWNMLGGFSEGFQTLSQMAPLMPEKLQALGMNGWTQGAEPGSPMWMVIWTTLIYGVGLGVLAQPQLVVRFMTVPNDRELEKGVIYGTLFILLIPGVIYSVGAFTNAIFYQQFGKISIQMAGGNLDKIIPTFIETIMPHWYSTLFLLAMLAAAMSTLASQYHVGGTSLGRDVYEQYAETSSSASVKVARYAVTATVFITLVWAWVLPGSIIARATAFFFGLCLATFLPAYLLGLFWKGMTRAGAIASMLGGFACSMFWMLFIHGKSASGLGLCEALTGNPTLVSTATPNAYPWMLQFIDPNVMALPAAAIIAITVSKFTAPYERSHIDKCWSEV